MLIAACMLDFHVFIIHNIVDVGNKHCLYMLNKDLYCIVLYIYIFVFIGAACLKAKPKLCFKDNVCFIGKMQQGTFTPFETSIDICQEEKQQINKYQ